MKLEVFKEIVEKLKEQDGILNKTYGAGIDLTNIFDPIQSVVSYLIGSIYGMEGLGTFEWWCYDKEWGSNTEIKMTDKDGNVLCETIEELHQWLEENADNTFEIPKKLSDAERLKLIENMFNR